MSAVGGAASTWNWAGTVDGTQECEGVMSDEESRVVTEVAGVTGKTIDAVRALSGFLNDVFGDAFREFGGTVADWARYLRYRNTLLILDKVKATLARRSAIGKTLTIPPRISLPLLEGASLEFEEDIQALWAGLIANTIDPMRAIKPTKVFIEILRGLEPLDARVLQFLADPKLDQVYNILTRATVNVDVIASGLNAEPEDVKIALQTLARYQCVVDAWEQTLESLDYGGQGFQVENPKSNFRPSHLGKRLLAATRISE